MTLKEYKHKTGVPYSEIARKCGKSPKYMSDVAAGKYRPNPRIARMIELATSFNVPYSQWYEE
jgi:transcriptional regulator with XRE-family HTH domain